MRDFIRFGIPSTMLLAVTTLFLIAIHTKQPERIGRMTTVKAPKSLKNDTTATSLYCGLVPDSNRFLIWYSLLVGKNEAPFEHEYLLQETTRQSVFKAAQIDRIKGEIFGMKVGNEWITKLVRQHVFVLVTAVMMEFGIEEYQVGMAEIAFSFMHIARQAGHPVSLWEILRLFVMFWKNIRQPIIDKYDTIFGRLFLSTPTAPSTYMNRIKTSDFATKQLTAVMQSLFSNWLNEPKVIRIWDCLIVS